jgi:arsenate reductase
LQSPLASTDLEHFLDVLPNEPAELVRKDKNFKALELDAADYTTREAVVKVLLEHPKLMQRPVVILGDRAVIARPSEKVLELID